MPVNHTYYIKELIDLIELLFTPPYRETESHVESTIDQMRFLLQEELLPRLNGLCEEDQEASVAQIRHHFEWLAKWLPERSRNSAYFHYIQSDILFSLDTVLSPATSSVPTKVLVESFENFSAWC